MKLGAFLKDKLYVIIYFIIFYSAFLLMLFAFKVNNSFIIVFSFSFFILLFLILTQEFLKKYNFYNKIIKTIENLDKAYLVLETLEKPDFFDGELLYQILYEINKSMNENVKLLEIQSTDFKEYIEMWIHEVKIPLASLTLMSHNYKNKFDKKVMEELKRIEDSVEEVLYYVRCENAEKDYLINKVLLNKVISNLALKNKDNLLENKIDFIVENVNISVYSDSKWLEFILNQIINNSIKYKKDNNSYIKIYTKEEKKFMVIIIEDNGIGIPKEDLPKVFNKSFTGINGRIKGKSTGMGLFIVKSLCDKLGHLIKVESKKDEFTRVYIKVPKNEFYDVL